MLTTWQYRLLTMLGIAALLLVIVNATLFTLNRTKQLEVNGRQQFVQQSVQLEGLYRDIVKALAELAVKGNDTQILQMLTAQGISVTSTPPPSPVTQAPPAPLQAGGKK